MPLVDYSTFPQKAKENTEAEIAVSSTTDHIEASDASRTTNSLGSETTTIPKSAGLSEDSVEAERSALLAEKAALLAESQELEQTLKVEPLVLACISTNSSQRHSFLPIIIRMCCAGRGSPRGQVH